MDPLSLGSSVLSAVLQVVFDRATTYAHQQLVGVTSDLKPSLKKLQMSLSIIRSRVSDAEKRVLGGGDAALGTWLMELKDVIYEADGRGHESSEEHNNRFFEVRTHEANPGC